MLGALAGLPQLGGLGGGFGGGGGLEMLGFGLLGALTSALTTRSFLGSPTAIPDFRGPQTPAFNSIPSNFGSYFGSAGGGYGAPAQYGSPYGSSSLGGSYGNPYEAPNFISWHNYLVGNASNPYAMPPQGITYGTSGAYQAGVSYGSSGISHNGCGCPPGYSSPLYQVPSYQSLPAYGGYQNAYQQIPVYGNTYGVQNLSWNYATQSAYYTPAMPSYTQPMVQYQSPYGYGGSSPFIQCTPPPNYGGPRPTRPPCHCSPPPVSNHPPHQCGPTPERVRYDKIQRPIQNYDQAAKTMADRMVGDPYKIGRYSDVTPRPEVNKDSLRFQRQALYSVMQQDSSLRYNVDSGKFFRTYEDGSTKDVLSMSQLTQITRQNCPPGQEYAQIGQLLKSLPRDSQLFGNYGGCQPTAPEPPAPPPPPPPPQPPRAQPQPQQPVIPPTYQFGSSPVTNGQTVVPSLPSSGSLGAPTDNTFRDRLAQAQSQVQTERASGNLNSNTLNLEILRIASQAGAIRNVGNSPSQGSAPFSVTAHRYWDSSSGGYVNVSEVAISDPFNSTVRSYNPSGQTSVSVTQPNAPLGRDVKVEVTWENGRTRVWDYSHTDGNLGTNTEVYSPLG